jgi:hypothetical protein
VSRAGCWCRDGELRRGQCAEQRPAGRVDDERQRHNNTLLRGEQRCGSAQWASNNGAAMLDSSSKEEEWQQGQGQGLSTG